MTANDELWALTIRSHEENDASSGLAGKIMKIDIATGNILGSITSPGHKLKKDMLERIKRCAEAGGYSSTQEFVEHILTRELAKLEDAESDEEIVKKLKGLGYLE
jgi:hypothetical protein